MGSGKAGVARGRRRRRLHTPGRRPDVPAQHRLRRPLPDDGSGRPGRRVGYRRALLCRAPGVPRGAAPAVTYLPAARPVGRQVRCRLLRRLPAPGRLEDRFVNADALVRLTRAVLPAIIPTPLRSLLSLCTPTTETAIADRPARA